MIKNRRFITLDCTGSTNDDLKACIAAADGPVCDVIAAKTQTGGRGRLGRSFFSPPGGLYFSAALPLTGSETNVPCLTLIAGLCVCRALEELCGVSPQIKWPNDLYLNGKKLCGILCELATGKTLTAIVGIGVNLTAQKKDFPAELAEKMTSLSAEGFAAPLPEALLTAVVTALDHAVYEEHALADGAVAARYMKQLRERSFLTGKAVRYAANGQPLRGIFIGIADTGEAVIDVPGQGPRRVISGEITLAEPHRSV